MKIFDLILLVLMMSGSVSAVRTAMPMIEPVEDTNPGCMGYFESPQKTDIADLPLKVLRSTVESSLPMLVLISGDGGWNSFDESLCNSLTQKGIPVVVLDARKYFWKNRTPEETTVDLTTVIEAYQNIWKRDRFVLAGFSFGASIIPFLVNRLPADVTKRLASSILISPDKTCDFEIHLSDMLNLGLSKGKNDVIREIQLSNFKNMAAFFGSDESKDIRQAFLQTGIKVKILQGNHHFDSSYEALADMIEVEIKSEQ